MAQVGLRILMISDNPEEAVLLASEITTLFEGCVITSATSPDITDASVAGSHDLVLVNLVGDDPDSHQLVLRLREQIAGLPIIVILPSESASRSESLSRLDSVYCLPRTERYQNKVTVTIEEILRQPVSDEANSAFDTGGSHTQAELIRTAAGTLAHEINNPLMAILGISELILNDQTSNNPDVARKVTMIRCSAERIEWTLKRLAEISEPVLRHTPAGAIIDPEQSRRTGDPAKTRS